jgi:uncharacterized protein
MSDYDLIALFSCLGALLTFFSGFGLGTILLPVFALFFPLPQAILLTAIVHLLNNLFKGFLIYKHIQFSVVLKFGIPAIVFAFAGAYCLELIEKWPVLYWINNHSVPLVAFILGIVILFFALFEILPIFQKLSFPPSMVYVGGMITGFFGGLSGHQGALRSAFFLRLGLSKEQLIGTGTAVAILIDVTRLSVYFKSNVEFNYEKNTYYLLVAIFAAFLGSYLGAYFLKKMTIPFVQKLVAFCLIGYGVALLMGYVSTK